MKNLFIGILGIATLGLAYFSFTKSAISTSNEGQTCKSPIAVYEDPTRIPLRDFVLEEMGDLSGKIVGDIGAGPGFFAFKMAESADKVIATELDPLFLNYMRDKKSRLDQNNLEVLEASDDHSELINLNLDKAVMVFVFHYLEDPKLFLENLKKGLQPGGEVFIANGQMSSVIIQDYLGQAGFADIGISHFSFTQPGGCGDLDVQLIRAKLSIDHVQL